MKIILLVILSLALLAFFGFMLLRWAQRRYLYEMMRGEGLLKEEQGIKTAISFMNHSDQWLKADLYLSQKRILAYKSFWQPPFIHIPFAESTMEMLFAIGKEGERQFLTMAAPSRQGEVKFYLTDARDWMCTIERLGNSCKPESCSAYDPALCGECPGERSAPDDCQADAKSFSV